MYKTAEKQKIQTGTKAAPAQRATSAPATAIPNFAMASMAEAGESGHANPNLDQMMQARMSGLHEDMAAEQEAVDVGRQFMNSTDVVGDMSRAYGQDLSGVRLHTDPGAAQKAEARGVDAFSTGRDIYFAEGAYDRSDPASRGLLAHELSHPLQQGVGGDASVMSQSAPVGAEQGGWRDWFRKKPKQPEQSEDVQISEPQLKEQRSWEQGLFSDAIAQRDNALGTAKTDKEKAAVQAQFMKQMEKYSNIEGGGKVTANIGKIDRNYNDIRGAALHQIVLGTSPEDMKTNIGLQDRIVNGFNTRMGEKMESYNNSDFNAFDVKERVFRENNIGELVAYNDMLKRMATSDMAPAMYAAAKKADPDPVRGHKGLNETPDSSHGYLEAIDALNENVEKNEPLLRVLEAARPAFARSNVLNSDKETSEVLMNNFALRVAAAEYSQLNTGENALTMGRRAGKVQSEINNGMSENRNHYSDMLNRVRKKR